VRNPTFKLDASAHTVTSSSAIAERPSDAGSTSNRKPVKYCVS